MRLGLTLLDLGRFRCARFARGLRQAGLLGDGLKLVVRHAIAVVDQRYGVLDAIPGLGVNARWADDALTGACSRRVRVAATAVRAVGRNLPASLCDRGACGRYCLPAPLAFRPHLVHTIDMDRKEVKVMGEAIDAARPGTFLVAA